MEFIRTRVEVPTSRPIRGRGIRPSYRWTNGYIQKTSPTNTLHPAVSYYEAQRLAKAAGEKMVVIEEADNRDALAH